jgi:uncharacterized protein (TIGR02996 family)
MTPEFSPSQVQSNTIEFKTIKEGRLELERIEQQIYSHFISDTERTRRRRRGEEVTPNSDCVSTTLSAKSRSPGEALLSERDAIVQALNEVTERRSVRLRRDRAAEREREQHEEYLRAEWNAYLSRFTADHQFWLRNTNLKCFGMWWLCATDHELSTGEGLWAGWVRTRRLPQGPEELLFMQNLAANPDDVTAWLVYADWLGEHGEVVFSAHSPGELAKKIRRHVESNSSAAKG